MLMTLVSPAVTDASVLITASVIFIWASLSRLICAPSEITPCPILIVLEFDALTTASLVIEPFSIVKSELLLRLTVAPSVI